MLSLNEYRNDYRLTMNYQGVSRVREDTHKKVVGPLRVYPPYTYGLVVHATYCIYFMEIITISI